MSSAIIAQLAIIAVGVLALATLMRRLGRLVPRRSASPFAAALAPGKEPMPVLDEFASIQRIVDGARFSAFDVHYGLRPLLRELAASRLRVRRGIELDAEPGPASEVLGAEAFALLREGHPAPSNYRRPGMSLHAIERIVKVLESI
jgi:hypothetical protein